MTRTLQLGNADNWQQIFNTSVAAVTLNSTAYVPIPEITAPLLLETHVLATYITTNIPEGRKWNFAGFLNQKFELGLTVGGTPEADNLTRRKLWLNRIQLIILPKLTANYAISFDVPEWFKNVNVTLWQYVGVDYDSTEQALSADVMPALTRIESKIDAL
ncbi:hypothetical protein I8748_16430 [Nostoc sp. CENA67]|uniref:Uncharacterized protein n=1 Tax=Amazonocrinis nigriterrae CENA67 TaxID=2794033 RepID=A0A8J7HPX1_9NOST|nr:hypothetical protein [Amazonocrinis nigriterrae]MBH8563758.1 hypothetical protein [Amazonocrinis nigriterrae CENA67]